MKNEKELSVEGVLENGNGHAGIVVSSPHLGEPVHDIAELEPLPSQRLRQASLDEYEDHHSDGHDSPDPDSYRDNRDWDINYSHLSKKELVSLVQELSRISDFKKVDSALREIKPIYDAIFGKEKSAALARYREADGLADGFEYKGDEADQAFDAALKLIHNNKNQFYRSLEERKSGNLLKKLEVLDKLRALVDAEDSEHSFHQFKQLQQEWKNIGPVAVAQVKTLWANFGALVDRFYDHRSIYFELKELDRKKNLEAKLELCEKAERLASAERMKDSILELNELHSEFRHVGPVPKEDQESVWQRFKAASDGLYARRDAYVSQLQHALQKNLQEKLTLVEELAVFAAFQSDRIKEWNLKTQEILQLQKKWEAVGAVPRSKSKEINKKFWTSFKSFFNNKNSFFKKLDEERDKNFQRKTEIIKKAQELQGSSDWDRTANELKELQRQWNEVGPVPEKLREKVFQEFKQACDHFFAHRREQFEKADREQEVNFHEKEMICAELERLTIEKTGSLSQLTELQNRFSTLGFVPKKSVTAIKVRFNEVVEKFLASIKITTDEKDRAMLEVQLGNLKNDPEADRKIFQKEQVIRKRINKVENEIAVLRNNLEFFGRSKNAEKFKEEFNAKIDEANGHLTQLKSQLKMLRTVSK